MSVNMTPAYIRTVEVGHTVNVPSEVPVGATVAILLLPPAEVPTEEVERKERFASVFAAIRAAIAAGYTAPPISDDDLDARIRAAKNQRPL